MTSEDVFASFRDEFSHINLKRFADAEQRIKRWIPRIRFQRADERLTEPCLLSKDITGDPTPFSLLDDEPYYFGRDLLSNIVFGHPCFLGRNSLDNAYHYTDNAPMFIRRLGQNGQLRCSGGHHCSQVLEMTDGDFAAAGLDITKEAVAALPPGPGVGPKEAVVRIPRKVMLAAASEILAGLAAA